MRNKNFIIIVIGEIISLFGNAVLRFSMSLYLLDLTGSAGVFSTILAISTIPYIIFAPLSGYLSDTINKKKIMMTLNFISGLLITIYGIFIIDKNSVIASAVIMFVLSVIYTLYTPAVTSSIPQIVNKEKLSSANSIVQQISSGVNILAPIIAGILYSFINIKIILLISGFSFILAGILEVFLKIPDVKNKSKVKKFIVGSFVEMKDVFFYLKRDKKAVFNLIMSYPMGNIFIVPILSIIAPYSIKIRLELPGTAYGFAEAVFVLGIILGGALITLKPKVFKIERIHLMIIPMFIGIIIMIIASLELGNKLILVGIFSVGGLGIMLSLGLSNIISLTYIQKESPENKLGKISAFSTAIATVSIAPGQIIFGRLIDLNIPIFIILMISLLLSFFLARFLKRTTIYIE